MENLQQTLLEIKQDIGFIRGELKGINNRLEKINGNIIHHDKKIDDLETDCDKLQEAFKPIKKAYNNLAMSGIGVLVLLGSVGLSIFLFFKDKLLK